VGSLQKNNAVNALRYTVIKKKNSLKVYACKVLPLVMAGGPLALCFFSERFSGKRTSDSTHATRLRALTCLISLSGEIITLCKRSIAGGSS
jgi:hypothetical protein